ncbi:aminotransferase class V-fold PLP-dependent enzyme [Thiomicrospira cyclica]|uniref:Cysteine desulfurase n=1 Tax=Thiomicrospira cyclica (strain DSM 14477 / JCM 11371 / ALM1) TaxID=717773 RepID=F6D9L7_THICA|nr:cysteine desulfurase [Thiomicrospira cyclica]AEG30974.1 cysteine desulfurase, SufS subfamily [Thiomicrospira cyclica ALM1]
MIDNQAIRAEFPLLSQTEKDLPLVYLDNASTSQKPQQVIDAVAKYYASENANVHRGVYGLSERATEAFEGVRGQVQRLLNANTTKEVIFVRGATEGINLVASSWGRSSLKPGDQIIVSEMEHHSNLVPWQLLVADLGIEIVKWPIDARGQLHLEDLAGLLNDKTRLVAVTHMSNALGSINPINEIITMAHQQGAKVLVDAAQSISHMPIDVQALDVDFLVFSGHKMYAPTGIGVLYAKQALLEQMPPYMGGGDMIYQVSFEATTFNELPYKFEAGTPNIAGVIGLGSAISFIERVGFDTIAKIENDLLDYATARLSAIPGLRIIGEADHKGAVISFVFDQAHPHDIATLIDQDAIALRASHHCAMPVMLKFNLPATLRASFGVYNNRDDVDRLCAALVDALDMLA